MQVKQMKKHTQTNSDRQVQTGTDRERQGQAGTDRDIQGQTGTDSDKQGLPRTSREKQGQKGTVPVYPVCPCLSMPYPCLPCLVPAFPCPVPGINQDNWQIDFYLFCDFITGVRPTTQQFCDFCYCHIRNTVSKADSKDVSSSCLE